MAWIRVKSTLVKEVTMEEAESFKTGLRGDEGMTAEIEIADTLAEALDMDWDKVEVEVLDDDGKEM